MPEESLSPDPYDEALVTAAAMFARAYRGDWAGLWDLTDEVARGDGVRETLAVLTELATGVARGALRDPDRFLQDLAGAAAEKMVL